MSFHHLLCSKQESALKFPSVTNLIKQFRFYTIIEAPRPVMTKIQVPFGVLRHEESRQQRTWNLGPVYHPSTRTPRASSPCLLSSRLPLICPVQSSSKHNTNYLPSRTPRPCDHGRKRAHEWTDCCTSDVTLAKICKYTIGKSHGTPLTQGSKKTQHGFKTFGFVRVHD